MVCGGMHHAFNCSEFGSRRQALVQATSLMCLQVRFARWSVSVNAARRGGVSLVGNTARRARQTRATDTEGTHRGASGHTGFVWRVRVPTHGKGRKARERAWALREWRKGTSTALDVDKQTCLSVRGDSENTTKATREWFNRTGPEGGF